MVALVGAFALGFGGMAAVSAFAAPDVPVAHGFGQGDGLTRYVVTAASGPVTPRFVRQLEGVPGVANAQALRTGAALVATKELTLQQLRAVPGVGEVSFSPQAQVFGTAITDPYWSTYGYNLKNTGSNSYHPGVAGYDVDAPDGWTAGTGAGMIVADLDTGFYVAHEDLQGALWTNPQESCGSTTDTDHDGYVGDCHGWNFTTNTASVDNGSGGEHGTTTAGVMGARLNNGRGTAGVAPSVQIMPLVIGSGENVDINAAIQAIYYAVDHGASAINASWGGSMDPTTLANLTAAINYAGQHGVLFVTAAGNDGGNRDTNPVYPASLGGNGPNSLPNVITVGNMDPNGAADTTSGYGTRTVDLFAPGDLIFTTWNNDNGQLYMLVSGTSEAAPHVTAAVALYEAKMYGGRATTAAQATAVKAAILADAQRNAQLTGKSVTGAMLSLARLAAPADPVTYTFSAMSEPVGTVTPKIDVAGSVGAGDYAVRIGLGMHYQGQTWGVSGTQITLNGQTVTTDDNGEATFDLGSLTDVGPQQLAPSVMLGAGQYALTVQTYKDGAALGRTFAAPLFVGTSSSGAAGSGSSRSGGSGSSTSGAGSGTGSGPGGSSGTGGGSGAGAGGSGSGAGSGGIGGSGSSGSGSWGSPGTGSSGSGSSGTGSGSWGSPGTGSGSWGSSGSGSGSWGSSGSASGTGSWGSSGSGSSGSGSWGSSGTGSGTGSWGSSGFGSSGSGSWGSSGSASGSSGHWGSGGAGSSTGSGSGDLGGQQSYSPTGTFGLTSISPTRVSTAGGTSVTVTGTSLPANPRILIAGTNSSRVTSWSGTRVTFITPALAAGTYDVTVFDATGQQSSTLRGALTFVAVGSGGTGTGSGSGTGTGTGTGSGSGTGTGTGSGAGGTGTGSGTGGSGSGSSGSAGSGSGGGSGSGSGGSGASAPASATGPNGEHLVASSRYASLTDAFWSGSCSTSCGGLAI